MEKDLSMLESIKKFFPLPDKDIRGYSPLTLAFIGDGVYELVVRTVAVLRANQGNNMLHQDTVRYVKAPAQARMVEIIKPLLSQEEQDILRRGRNASPHSTAKNATLGEYHKATGFETLIGYLYLTGQTERMLELIRAGMDGIDAEKDKGKNNK